MQVERKVSIIRLEENTERQNFRIVPVYYNVYITITAGKTNYMKMT